MSRMPDKRALPNLPLVVMTSLQYRRNTHLFTY